LYPVGGGLRRLVVPFFEQGSDVGNGFYGILETLAFEMSTDDVELSVSSSDMTDIAYHVLSLQGSLP
jgi:hypothetical protein